MHVLKKYMRTRRFSLLGISLPLLMGVSFAFAQQARDGVGPIASDSNGGKVKEKAAQVLKPAEVDHAGSKIERWYTYWALGYNQMSYNGKMDGLSILPALEKSSNPYRGSVQSCHKPSFSRYH